MQKHFLGNTGIQVTELCFGVLPMGPLQADIPVDKGAKVIRAAVEGGVNFFDTAETYRTYTHIRHALAGFNHDVVIATKSSAVTYAKMEDSVQNALRELGRDFIDIFLLHAAKADANVFLERNGAFQCLLDYKRRGVIRSVGISTHVVEVVNVAAQEPEVDIVFPIINMLGMGIVGGSREDMLKAIAQVYTTGKGLYAMKALAGGHLIGRLPEALNYVRQIQGISAVAVGMVNEQELAINLKLFNNEDVEPELLQNKTKGKKLLIAKACKGCGTCVETCPNNALSKQNDKVVVEHNHCIMCGYCSRVCPEFALRMV